MASELRAITSAGTQTAEVPMDVGLELRQARERRGISLQQISHTTKISARVLQAIEASDPQRLPAAVYTRGFVKSYAAEVGLDPDDTIRRYFAQFDAREEQPAELAAESGDAPAQPAHREAPRPSPARVLQGRFGTSAVVALAILTLLALLGGRDENQRAPALDQTRLAAAGFVPAATPQPGPVGTSGTTAAGPMRIMIAPTGPCWISATVDDQRVLATLLDAGDRRMIDAAAVTLRVGDPAACAFTIDGKPARVPGAAGQATTVVVSRENYAQLLAR